MQLQTVDVLVAKIDIGLGQSVTAEDMHWQTWPAATTSTTFIRRSDRPDAKTKVAGSIARSPFIAGEPIREQKLVRADGSGFMAAILPTGMRAISTEISAETGAGGFILPNDRVDVILSKRREGPGPLRARHRQFRNYSDQYSRARDRSGAEGKRRRQRRGRQDRHPRIEARADRDAGRSRQSGTLSLSLRSIADVNQVENKSDEQQAARRGDSVNVVRYGVPSSTTTRSDQKEYGL